MLLHDVIQTIRRHNLLLRGQHILVGVSGGADSVALLAVLRALAPAWKLRLTVAHLNHGIRGPAAAADAAFVAGLARRWKFKFVGAKVNVPVQARRRGISLEMAGRSARYAFFAKVARTHHCDAVATAHTADDQAETILLNLARGAGAAGLAGIPYIGWHDAFKLGLRHLCRSISPGRPGSAGALRPGESAPAEPGERPLQWPDVDAVRKNRFESKLYIKVVRPLRDVDRKSIERFLESRHLAWREDATNADPAFLRNRVRHEVLPFLEERLNPGIRLALLRASDILTRENEWLEMLTDRLFTECREVEAGLDASRLAGFPVAARRRVLRRWLEACGLNAETLGFETIERLDKLVTDRRGGRAVTLAGGWLVRRHGDKLALSMDRHGNFPPEADNPGSRAREGVDFSGSHGVTAAATEKVPRSSRTNSRTESVLPFSVRLVVPGQTLLPKQGGRITARIGPGIVKERPASIGALPAHASLSLRAWRKRRLVARSWKPGDRMRPLGMQGTKKLQDIFSDGKVPPTLRHSLPVIACQGEIIWIPGFRIAQGWAVRPDEPLALQLAAEPLALHGTLSRLTR